MVCCDPLRAGVFRCASLCVGFRPDRTRLTGAVCAATATRHCRFLLPRAQSNLRGRRRRMDRTMDSARACELDGYRRGCGCDARRTRICGWVRRTDFAQKVRSGLRRVLSKRAPLVAAIARLATVSLSVEPGAGHRSRTQNNVAGVIFKTLAGVRGTSGLISNLKFQMPGGNTRLPAPARAWRESSPTQLR